MRFEDFVIAQSPSLLRLAYVLTADAHQAEDLAQTTLTDAFRKWRRVRRAQDPAAYVSRMLINAHLDRHRRRSAGEIPVEPATLRGRLPEAGPGGGPADIAVDRDELRRLLAMLPPRARTVLVLRYYADLDDATIAEILAISPSTVRSTAARSLASLRTRGAQTTIKEGR